MSFNRAWMSRLGKGGPTGQEKKFNNRKVYETPEGLPVGADHKGPKKKVADSKAEYKRLNELRGRVKRGEIQFLSAPATLRIYHPITGERVCNYIADFRYVENGKVVVEDVKGMLTSVYKLKKRLVKLFLGIDIVEIGRKPKKKKESK